MVHIAFQRGRQAADDDVAAAETAKNTCPSFVVVSTFPDPAQIKPRQWLYGGHYLLGTVSATIGDGGTGKTTLVLTEAIAMATGRPLLGVAPTMRTKVLVWNGDEPMDELQRRVAAICQQHKIDRHDLEVWLFIANALAFPITVDTETPQEDDGLPHLIDYISAHEIDVIIIDPFVACHRAPENDNTQIDSVVKAWVKIAAAQHIAVELVHHTSTTVAVRAPSRTPCARRVR